MVQFIVSPERGSSRVRITLQDSAGAQTVVYLYPDAVLKLADDLNTEAINQRLRTRRRKREHATAAFDTETEATIMATTAQD